MNPIRRGGLFTAVASLAVAGIAGALTQSPKPDSTTLHPAGARVLSAQLVAGNGAPANRGRGNGGPPPVPPGRSFTVRGTVEGLFPGVRVPLVVTVGNDNNFAINVKTVTVTPGNASAACPAGNLLTESFSGSAPVAANSTTTVTVWLTLEQGADDACQGLTFPLTYGGTAAQA